MANEQMRVSEDERVLVERVRALVALGRLEDNKLRSAAANVSRLLNSHYGSPVGRWLRQQGIFREDGDR